VTNANIISTRLPQNKIYAEKYFPEINGTISVALFILLGYTQTFIDL